MTCPRCGKEVKVIHFGLGYVAFCCGKVVYNSKERP